MGAARFVGRVGGLAVALGVGAAVFYAGGVASADISDRGARGADTADSRSSPSASSPSVRTRPPARRANPGASRGAATRSNDRAHAASPQVSAAPITVPATGVARRVAGLAVMDPESATDRAAPDDSPVAPPAIEMPEPAGPDVRVHIDPLMPADSPAAWAVLAAARREPLS
ncbi:MAG: hypothetical protein WBD88_01350, partial [Mycobacterium sp.]